MRERRRRRTRQGQDAYTTLQFNVELYGDSDQVLYITSPYLLAGKTTVAVELANSFAAAGRTTALVEADLRNTPLTDYLPQPVKKVGVSDYLQQKATLAEIIMPTNIERLQVVFGGTRAQGISELFNQQRLAELMGQLRNQFDVVILNTPPLTGEIDTFLLSKQCDAGVVVLHRGQDRYRQVRPLIQKLDAVGSKLLGCVLVDE
ncbi:CpsD/CapB family tyrosine-protein kinase [Ligilactobacillus saerimneri]|uniref:CpsD/CapB family tyrosine-protein kinase n=1 Tax=Ligilactobacillus saerimneri TaxID=228229 RepID=UPI0024B109F8|nr:CpsD/CapB family tyrosine-protein kinase [Ligilactobacillus saerimneri]MDI9205531.1 CpsD/CapB family tyrosine-protein kinase [Ligilactobacillus saerimneri]